MRLIRVISLSLLILSYGMPLPVYAQTATEAFSLPDVRVGEVYSINIASVLRDTYRLRLETDARAPLFRWALEGGELPTGLVIRPNGTVTGIVRTPRTEPYIFQVKVTGTPGGEPLIINLSLNVTTAKVRLVQVNAPKLVPLEGGDTKRVSRDNMIASTAGMGAAQTSNNRLSTGEKPARPVNVNLLLEGASDETRREAPTRLTLPTNPSTTADASDVRASMMRPQTLPTPACSAMPAPTAPANDVFYIDARNGNLSEKGQLVTSTRRFKRNERAVIVVDNKNPYLYTYKLTIQATPVLEPALDAFVPLIVGSLGDFKAKGGGGAGTSGGPKVEANGVVSTEANDSCADAAAKVAVLMKNVNAARDAMADARNEIEQQRIASRSLTDAYNAARLPLFSPNQTSQGLYSASKNFIDTVDSKIGASKGGVDRQVLDNQSADLEKLTREANRFKTRVAAIREAHPNCLNKKYKAEGSGALTSIDEWLRQASEAADDLLADAASYQKTITEIRTDLNKVIEARTNVLKVLCDPHAFFSESVVGQFEETNDVDIQLEVTPRQGVTEAQPVAGSPFRTKFTFGNAPFFSISGGLIFSPLKKREYIRVQGFELDAQGNQVLVNGKPNLTTVIGLKENSPSRIIPAVFLNGLLTERKTGFIDGVHFTLGITAKNDNKGTDVEFLVGPSLSMLERRMFFTFGGYAGKQQKLAGSLFEGLALPSTVTEVPVEKNYRWSFGFALSYRIPVTK